MTTVYQGSDIEVQVDLITTTPKAYLVNAGGKENVWVPKSMCDLVEGEKPGTHMLQIDEQYATEKGLV